MRDILNDDERRIVLIAIAHGFGSGDTGRNVALVVTGRGGTGGEKKTEAGYCGRVQGTLVWGRVLIERHTPGVVRVSPGGGILDNTSLDCLLSDGPKRHFWLKPIGPPKDHPEWAAPEHRVWTQREIEIHFSKSPVKVAVGAIIIAYRVRIQKLIYVAEHLPREEWSDAEVRSEYSRRRWPFHIKGRNLTPEYGRVWDQFNLQPFPLAKEYNALHPMNTASLGSILRGNDKAMIPYAFAQLLLRRIREIEKTATAERSESASDC